MLHLKSKMSKGKEGDWTEVAPLLSEAKANVAAHQETFLQCECQPVVKPSLWGSAGNLQVCVSESGPAAALGRPGRMCHTAK